MSGVWSSSSSSSRANGGASFATAAVPNRYGIAGSGGGGGNAGASAAATMAAITAPAGGSWASGNRGGSGSGNRPRGAPTGADDFPALAPPSRPANQQQSSGQSATWEADPYGGLPVQTQVKKGKKGKKAVTVIRWG
jgi:hypothetical protein